MFLKCCVASWYGSITVKIWVVLASSVNTAEKIKVKTPFVVALQMYRIVISCLACATNLLLDNPSKFLISGDILSL